MQKQKKNNGITLIALVITIIVLLILAGVTINLVLRENGIFGTAQNAADKHQKAEIKEEIELAILEIQTEKIIKGSVLELKDLPVNLLSKISGIEAELKNNQIEGTYKGYNYVIDNNFKVTIGEEAKGVSISYTLKNAKGEALNSDTYADGDVVLTVIPSTTNGGIERVTGIEGLTKQADGTYKAILTANGTYNVTVEDDAGVAKTINIEMNYIDKLPPKKPTIEAIEISSTKIKVQVEAEDEEAKEESIKSNIGKYEYHIGTETITTQNAIHEFTTLTKNTTYTIYVIVYDKAGNPSEKSENITPKTSNGEYATLTLGGIVGERDAIDALNGNACDGDFTTHLDLDFNGVMGAYETHRWIKVDSECWGKYITIYCQTIGSSYGYIQFYDDYWGNQQWGSYLHQATGSISELCARSFIIQEGTKWITLSTRNC